MPRELKALVLAGGLSTRMKTQKALLIHPGSSLPMYLHTADLLSPSVPSSTESESESSNDVYFSLRSSQLSIPAFAKLHTEHPERVIVDDAERGDIGPAGGLLAAHERDGGADWVVLAVDFPRATREAVKHLVERSREGQREGEGVTCYVHEDGGPEPVFAVWTAGALRRLKENAVRGRTGPCFTVKEVWKEGRVGAVKPARGEWIVGANTREEWEAALVA
ncbi:MobA-like NTP transferase domain-containing protein [Crassisporium funariophilum]|nr:MobA-like NTP transferase domain-containing protein [Crassisporium funariophilum]